MSGYSVVLSPDDWDSDNLYYDGSPIGWVGKKHALVGVQVCPECGRENYSRSVLSGKCSWCGWAVDKNAARAAVKAAREDKAHV